MPAMIHSLGMTTAATVSDVNNVTTVAASSARAKGGTLSETSEDGGSIIAA